jgi:NitT/TauT family transport system substrate-binding protein
MSSRRVRLVHEYFHPWPNSAGFYWARSRGWYADAGIDLEFVLADPGIGDGLEYVNRGRAEFAVFPSSRLFQRRDLGQPLVAFAAVNQCGLETVRTVRSTGITRLRDLAGRSVGLNPTPRGIAIVRDLVARDGGNPNDVRLVDLGARELTAYDIEAGEVDATYGSYWAWDNLRDDFPANEQLVWNVDEHLGVGYHSYLLGTRDDQLAEDRDFISLFRAITARGFEAAAADPGQVAALYERVTPYFSRSLIDASARLASTTWLHRGRWGALRPELLAPYAAWMADHGLVGDSQIWLDAVSISSPEEFERLGDNVPANRQPSRVGAVRALAS